MHAHSSSKVGIEAEPDRPGPSAAPRGSRGGENFRSKYFMAINVPGAAKLQDKSAALAHDGPGSRLIPNAAEAHRDMGYGNELSTSL